MPESNESAATELSLLLKSRGVTARAVARHMGVTESWLSRRLNGFVDMRVNEYSSIRKSIDQIAELRGANVPA
ncbi:helix-turn-helix domain-containing protein [Leucobacter aridicollis]|uniref:helix-turn-helix domain-containing protein n=1 Tax=Leucobacter aridicollis TaxID=283878 RepID=UPI0021035CFE|nr:hypothetical protein [Leucobacter aridicollis]UTX53315.1 hypothetical protein KI794_00655 [Leucobacter aridicollis]